MGRLVEWIKKRLGIKNTSHEYRQIAVLKVMNKEAEEESGDMAKESIKSREEAEIEMYPYTSTGTTLKEVFSKRNKEGHATMTNNERRRRGIPLKRKRGFATVERNERRITWVI